MEDKNTKTYLVKWPWQFIHWLFGYLFWVDILIRMRAKNPLVVYRAMLAREKRSYLRLSSREIEYQYWPSHVLRCGWEDVEKIKRRKLLGDTIVLSKADIEGSMDFSILIGKPQIHLNSLRGWPDGPLADDLRRYAPHLFES